VLAGLLANSLWEWWWLDPLAGLLVAGVAIKEGRDAWCGDGCCGVPGAEAPPCACGPGCTDTCCAPQQVRPEMQGE
jgi:hypothetical protein